MKKKKIICEAYKNSCNEKGCNGYGIVRNPILYGKGSGICMSYFPKEEISKKEKRKLEKILENELK